MRFGIYVHIPYCIQRCRYCDFTTFEQNKILPPHEYVEFLKKEIRSRAHLFNQKNLTSIYFGGGTPSLIEAQLIVDIINEIANQGFNILPDTEITLEINPATLNPDKIQMYLQAGVNRFSVGAQTFDDSLLKLCGREHSAQNTIDTLTLLNEFDVTFTADILFALPHQTAKTVQKDIDTLLSFHPKHISAYCLTVPPSHPMSQGRAPEEEQLEMFDLIEDSLKRKNILRYEISNFSTPGFESKHNKLYWSDNDFWGLGLSAHSYVSKTQEAPYGIRFWNDKQFQPYFDHLKYNVPQLSKLPKGSFEVLMPHEAMTDYCHMFLRTHKGLNLNKFKAKFNHNSKIFLSRVNPLLSEGLLAKNNDQIQLTDKGRLISNHVFESLTFLAKDGVH